MKRRLQYSALAVRTAMAEALLATASPAYVDSGKAPSSVAASSAVRAMVRSF